MSGDGTVVAFTSYASNLVPGDTSGDDVFMHDLTTGTTIRISALPDGIEGTGDPAVSADGSVVAYSATASELLPGDDWSYTEILVYDHHSGSTTRVSGAPDGAEGNGYSRSPSLSADGTVVAFDSGASNLVPGDTNLAFDVFVHDRTTGSTTRVSTDLGGAQANGWSGDPSLAANGDVVAFWSRASNLVAGDTNGSTDVFVVDLNGSPSATGFAVTVREDAPIGTVLGTVTTADPDGDPITCAIVAGNSTGLFTINPTTGTITTTAPLDYEASRRHVLTVKVSDGSLTDDTTVTVTVTDVAETPPLKPVRFLDDDDSIFEGDIEWIAARGITRGCNPPKNDRYCPDNYVTRGQMAAFLVRALGYTDDGGGDLFVDDDASIFEGDIDRLGTAEVTRGCNPPTNNRYCPTGFVTRGQMAAFLHRALD
jgi:hypothetical protein